MCHEENNPDNPACSSISPMSLKCYVMSVCVCVCHCVEKMFWFCMFDSPCHVIVMSLLLVVACLCLLIAQVYMMSKSGARGNISQVRQLVAMRGLMADAKGILAIWCLSTCSLHFMFKIDACADGNFPLLIWCGLLLPHCCFVRSAYWRRLTAKTRFYSRVTFNKSPHRNMQVSLMLNCWTHSICYWFQVQVDPVLSRQFRFGIWYHECVFWFVWMLMICWFLSALSSFGFFEVVIQHCLREGMSVTDMLISGLGPVKHGKSLKHFAVLHHKDVVGFEMTSITFSIEIFAIISDWNTQGVKEFSILFCFWIFLTEGMVLARPSTRFGKCQSWYRNLNAYPLFLQGNTFEDAIFDTNMFPASTSLKIHLWDCHINVSFQTSASVRVSLTLPCAQPTLDIFTAEWTSQHHLWWFLGFNLCNVISDVSNPTKPYPIISTNTVWFLFSWFGCF